MNTRFKAATSLSPWQYLLFALAAVLPLWNTGLHGFIYCGDTYFPIIPHQALADGLQVWRHGYMAGQGDITELMQIWPDVLLLTLLKRLGVSAAAAQRLLMAAYLFLLQVAFCKLFLRVFHRDPAAGSPARQYTLRVGGMLGGIFMVYNPYIFNILAGGQTEYCRFIAGLLFFVLACLDLLAAQGRGKLSPLLSSAFWSTICCGVNYFCTALFAIVAVGFTAAAFLVKRTGVVRPMALLFLLVLALNLWWAVPFAKVNSNSSLISLGLTLNKSESHLQSLMPRSLVDIYRLHYPRLGRMYPMQTELNDIFLSRGHIWSGYLLLFAAVASAFLFRNSSIYILNASFLFFLLLQAGGASPVFAMLWNSMPLFSIFRSPYKFCIFLVPVMAAMHSLTLSSALSRLPGRRSWAVIALCFTLLAVYNTSPMASGNLHGLYTPYVIPEEYSIIKTATDALSESYRILPLPHTHGVVKYVWAHESDSISFLDRLFSHPVLEIKVNSMYNARAHELLDANWDNPAAPAVWRLLNTRYILDRHDLYDGFRPILRYPQADAAAILGRLPLRLKTRVGDVYESPDFYPRVYAPTQIMLYEEPANRPVRSDVRFDEAMADLVDAGGAAFASVGQASLLWSSLPGPVVRMPSLGPRSVRHLSSHLDSPRISFQRLSPSRYLVRFRKPTAGFPLVLGEGFDYGWKVYAADPAALGLSAAEAPLSPPRQGATEVESAASLGPFFAWGRTPLFAESHYQANFYANLWWIDPAQLGPGDDICLVLEYDAQPWAMAGMLASGLTAMILALVWLASRLSSRVRRKSQAAAALLLAACLAAAPARAETIIWAPAEPNPAASQQQVFPDNKFALAAGQAFQLNLWLRPKTTTRNVVHPDRVLWSPDPDLDTGRTGQWRVDLSAAPLALDDIEDISLTWRRERNSGADFHFAGEVTLADAASGDTAPQTYRFTYAAGWSNYVTVFRDNLSEAAIRPKDNIYLVRRELGLATGDQWRSSTDQSRLVLQRHVDLVLADCDFLRVEMLEDILPEFQYSLDADGDGDRDDFIYSMEVPFRITTGSGGRSYVLFDLRGLKAARDLDPDRARIMELICFLPMSLDEYVTRSPFGGITVLKRRGELASDLSVTMVNENDKTMLTLGLHDLLPHLAMYRPVVESVSFSWRGVDGPPVSALRLQTLRREKRERASAAVWLGQAAKWNFAGPKTLDSTPGLPVFTPLLRRHQNPGPDLSRCLNLLAACAPGLPSQELLDTQCPDQILPLPVLQTYRPVLSAPERGPLALVAGMSRPQFANEAKGRLVISGDGGRKEFPLDSRTGVWPKDLTPGTRLLDYGPAPGSRPPLVFFAKGSRPESPQDIVNASYWRYNESVPFRLDNEPNHLDDDNQLQVLDLAGGSRAYRLVPCGEFFGADRLRIPSPPPGCSYVMYTKGRVLELPPRLTQLDLRLLDPDWRDISLVLRCPHSPGVMALGRPRLYAMGVRRALASNMGELHLRRYVQGIYAETTHIPLRQAGSSNGLLRLQAQDPLQLPPGEYVFAFPWDSTLWETQAEMVACSPGTPQDRPAGQKPLVPRQARQAFFLGGLLLLVMGRKRLAVLASRLRGPYFAYPHRRWILVWGGITGAALLWILWSGTDSPWAAAAAGLPAGAVCLHLEALLAGNRRERVLSILPRPLRLLTVAFLLLLLMAAVFPLVPMVAQLLLVAIHVLLAALVFDILSDIAPHFLGQEKPLP